jgi:hypothetical protein
MVKDWLYAAVYCLNQAQNTVSGAGRITGGKSLNGMISRIFSLEYIYVS